MEKNLNLELMEELLNLECFIVKAPVNHPGFWPEWQERYSRALMSLIATRKALSTKKFTSNEELKQYKALRSTYAEIVAYLEGLKRLALNLQGVDGPAVQTDFDCEPEDF
ncbi:MAG: hypothetical protein ABDH18_02715 [Aquificaceae bacterium]